MIYVTRIVHFNAAHKLWNNNWDEAKNKEVFGKCSNKNFHGHNYQIEVTVEGEPSIETGFVMNAKLLGDIIQSFIVEEVDHKNLNEDVTFMQGKLTSGENFTIAIWQLLYPEVEKHGVKLHKIKLVETPTIFVEYFG